MTDRKRRLGKISPLIKISMDYKDQRQWCEGILNPDGTWAFQPSEAQGRAEEAISAAEGPRGMLVYQTIPVRERSEMRLTDTPPETKWLHDAS